MITSQFISYKYNDTKLQKFMTDSTSKVFMADLNEGHIGGQWKNTDDGREFP